ncbi:MAG: hypothetical protein ABJE47_06555 [bacterium]
MTIDVWLEARTPRPPAALQTRIRAVLGDALSIEADQAPEIFLAAGERVVAALLRSNSTSRDSALDLLAADALVTYAFEASSTAPHEIERRASAAMTRIAALGNVTPAVGASQ